MCQIERPWEPLRPSAALTMAMETSPDYRPEVNVYEAPDGVLEVIIRRIDDDELEGLRRSDRRAPKRVH